MDFWNFASNNLGSSKTHNDDRTPNQASTRLYESFDPIGFTEIEYNICVYIFENSMEGLVIEF